MVILWYDLRWLLTLSLRLGAGLFSILEGRKKGVYEKYSILGGREFFCKFRVGLGEYVGI